jgi:hypothetical protein
MKKKIFLQLFLVTFLVFPTFGQNDNNDSKSSIADASQERLRLFDSDKLMDISLRFDLSSYLKTKPKEKYLNAIITFHFSETDSINKNIKLRSRGEFRNQHCYFPPIELNFKKANFEYADSNKFSKIKLVAQCNPGSVSENYILREYLVYKLFTVLTDTSFKVRLLKINYIDTYRTRKPIRQYGFLIEPIEMVAARTNSVEITSQALNQNSITPKTMDRLAIFNYMIGNYDWSIPGQHNVQVIKTLNFDPSGLGLGVVIPYDFDWTGLVDASYAIPAEIKGTETVRERIFLGICRSKEVYQKALEEFLEKKDEFYRVINEFPYLNQQSKKDITNYLNEFFNQINSKNTLVDTFLNNCKNF